MDGTWQRCANYDGFSQTLTKVCSGINLQVQIENYKIADCKGKVYSEDKILATTLLGAVGGSKTLAGATDIDVKMNPDIFYCGAGKAAYSIIQFAKDCRKLQIATPFANCSPSARPKTLEANPFTKN